MNISTVRSDLSEYAAILWAGWRTILIATCGCVVVMAALTWAAPRIYVVRAEVDAGALAQAQPVETNLFLEAIDRSQFVVEGGEFPETMPKGLTATFRPPSTIIMEAKSTDPASALKRLKVLTAAVEATLWGRFNRYAEWRHSITASVVTQQADANARLRRLTRLMEGRSSAATATTAAASRASTRRIAASLRPPLVQLRARLVAQTPPVDPSLIVSLDKVIADLSQDDDQGEQTRAAALRRQRDEALQLLRNGPIVDAASAKALQGGFERVSDAYADDPTTTAAIRDAKAAVARVVAAYDKEAAATADMPGLARTPKILAEPVMPAGPIWPKPMVNVAIAFLFGFVASVIFVMFRANLRLKS